MDTTVIEQELTTVIVEQEPTLLEESKKKFRAAKYDVHDETYARTLSAIECDNIAFNTFTENLMAEPRINRYCLLDAIEAYNLLPEAQQYPLSQRFQDEAFNCRPYQACIIS